MMEAKVSTAPIDRSRPSVMIMTVIGSASINRMVDCVRMLAMLAAVVNPGLSTPKIAHSTTSTIATPGTRSSRNDARLKARLLIGGSRGGRYWLR